MEIKQGDWILAQGLLVLLAQTLSAKGGAAESLPGFAAMALLADRAFKKPVPCASERFPRKVQLLPTLLVAQKQMECWIETIPAEEKAQDGNPAERPQINQPPAAKEKAAPRVAPRTLAPAVPGGESVSIKAGKLIEEVRLAIQTLSTSSFLSDPKPVPIRAALAKLKPLVDEFIEALSESCADSREERDPAPFKERAAFPVKKESAFKGQVPARLVEESVKKTPLYREKKDETQETGQIMEVWTRAKEKEREAGPAAETRKASPAPLLPDEITAGLQEMKVREKQDPLLLANRPPVHLPKQEGASEIKPQLPTSVPIPNPLAAFPLRTFIQAKKRRPKRYFFKDEDESPSH